MKAERLIALAARNLRRQLRRSVLTASAIGIGVAAIVVLTGLSEGFVSLMMAEVVEGRREGVTLVLNGV